MTGAEMVVELSERKGTKPSPGTLYPALKELKSKGLISSDKKKVYSLTKKGEDELSAGLRMFCTAFSDFQEMRKCCGK